MIQRKHILSMEISYLGHSSFKLRSREAVLITDPFDPKLVGMKFPALSADIVTISHQHADHNFLPAVEGNPLVISGPGEYEVKGIRIIGISTYHDNKEGQERGKNTVYRINMSGLSIVHCGDLGHKFNEGQAELLDGVDILLVPVGGVYTISSTSALEIVSQLEPSIVIPMHYKTERISAENFGQLSGLDSFTKEFSAKAVLTQPKLIISKEKLPAETTVVILE